MTAHICIVGSGPSGFYAADAIIRKLPDARIDIIDRLPTPYGLVRGGVAPDHQGTKAVARQFERICGKPTVRFLGNVAIGKDLSYAELKDAYDAVIIAIGAPSDRKLGIPGEDLPGVYGSSAFVGWYNGHPDHRDLEPRLDGSAVAVVGNGNVAIDVARVLSKTAGEMASSDLCGHAADVIAQANLTDVYLIGRRGPVEASFTSAELAELGHLERAQPVIEGADVTAATAPEGDAGKQKNLEILRGFAAAPRGDEPITLHLMFNAAPAAVLGESRVDGLRLERTRVEAGRAVATGEFVDLPVCAVVTAIGYRTASFDGLPYDETRGVVRNDQGRVEPGVYVVGWSKRGPSGTIPTNRADSIAVADLALADLAAKTTAKPGGEAIVRLLRERGVEAVDFAGWQRINDAETQQASGGKPREKLTRIGEMMDVAKRP